MEYSIEIPLVCVIAKHDIYGLAKEIAD